MSNDLRNYVCDLVIVWNMKNYLLLTGNEMNITLTWYYLGCKLGRSSRFMTNNTIIFFSKNI